jgi:hypothetical protein
MRFTYSDRADAELARRIDALLRQVARTTAVDARAGCPRSTRPDDDDDESYPGHTADTIKAIGNPVVVDNDPLWFYLEYGTRPHRIRPWRKKALWWEGAEHPVSEVHHPGTPEYAFMRQALYQRRKVLLP